MIVTISRQAASRGEQVAQAVAQHLGVPLVDPETVQRAAARIGLAGENLADLIMEFPRQVDAFLTGGGFPQLFDESLQFQRICHQASDDVAETKDAHQRHTWTSTIPPAPARHHAPRSAGKPRKVRRVVQPEELRIRRVAELQDVEACQVLRQAVAVAAGLDAEERAQQ